LKAVRHRNLAVFFEPRLGKTKVALDYAGILALKGEAQRVLVLAPSIALDVWTREIHKHFPYWCHVETFEEEWYEVAKDKAAFEDFQVEFFLAGREETFRATRPHVNLERPKQQELERWDPDVVVIDESHQYKRPGGRAAQDAWRMVRRLRKKRRDGHPYVLLLTGTPNPKGWRDLFAQLRIMDDTLLGTNAGNFDEDYVVRGEGRRKWAILGYRNTKRLEKIIRANSIACTAKQAGLAGKLFWQVLPATLPQRVRDQYDELAEEYIVQTDAGVLDAANQGVLRLRLLQLTSGFVTGGDQIHEAKTTVLRAYADSLCDQGEDVVVACRFTAEIDSARDILERVGFYTQVLDGRTKRRDKPHIVDTFQSSRRGPQALVVQHQAGSLSIELTRAAEVVFVTLPDDWVAFWQVLNRLRGPNQKRPVRVSAIIARNTVDRRVLYGLRRKEDWHGELMKDPHRFLGR
jgi:Type III restriction enzyme, res subunit/Helicase conserved C-terminal domain